MRDITARTQLGDLLKQHGIKYNSIEALLRETPGVISSKSSISRFVHGNGDANSVVGGGSLRPVFARAVAQLLAANHNLSQSAIDDLLTDIFQSDYKPMTSQRIELPLATAKFFGLRRDPFSHHPENRDEVFISPALREVIDRVVDAIRYQGFICVTGPIGSGKSTLRALMDDQVEDDANLHLIWPEFFDLANVSPMQIAEAILTAFDAPVPRSAVRRKTAVKTLLCRLFESGKRVAIAFDECHRLNDKALSSLKNFLEMNSGGFRRYLGVILFGQPIFNARLRESKFQEIFERITAIQMPEFQSSAREYLGHRLRLAGLKIDDLFDAEAIKLICNQATTPLSIGNLANESLIVSKKYFNNKRVEGSAIKTKMFFAQNSTAFRKRAA